MERMIRRAAVLITSVALLRALQRTEHYGFASLTHAVGGSQRNTHILAAMLWGVTLLGLCASTVLLIADLRRAWTNRGGPQNQAATTSICNRSGDDDFEQRSAPSGGDAPVLPTRRPMTLREAVDAVWNQTALAVALLLAVGLLLGFVLVPLGFVSRDRHEWLVTYGFLAIGSGGLLLTCAQLPIYLCRRWTSKNQQP